MRQEHAGLRDFAESAALDLCQEHCNRDLENRTDNDKQHIIQHGIPDNPQGLARLEEKLEVIDAVPFTAPDAAGIGVFLKRQNNTGHRIIMKQQGVGNTRQQHQQKYPVFVQMIKETFLLRLHKRLRFRDISCENILFMLYL